MSARSRMRLCRSIFAGIVAALALGRAQDTSARALPAGAAGHLYVVILPSGSLYSYVARYPLTNGIPAQKPDLVYPRASGSGPAWIDSAGRLYNVVNNQKQTALVEYAPNSTKRIRSINLAEQGHPSLDYYPPEFSGLTVDDAGFAYLAPVPNASEPSLHCASQISVYGATQKGYATPIQCLPAAHTYSLAADANGSLYVAGSSIADDAVFVIDHAASRPSVARTLFGPSFAGPFATALDSTGLLYVLNAGTTASYVAVYPKDANGRATPLRVITSRNGQWKGGVAVDDAHLYVATGSEVLVYDKFANGSPKPLASLTPASSAVNFIALGP